MDKPSKLDAEVAEKSAKKPWPLWKKLTIAGVALLLVIALAVGLGVGLTRNKGDSDDSDSSDDASDGLSNLNSTDAASTAVVYSNVWQPKAGTKWQIVLSKAIVPPSSSNRLTPNVPVWDLDLYDNKASTFAALKKQGAKVICYFSAGSWEDWRADKDDFAKKDLGKVMDGWPNEKWVNIRSTSVRNIMKKRIKLASDKGCDAIDPDNVDGYQNDNGLGLTQADSVSYMKFLSQEAAKYNMATGLKNAGDIIPKVLPYVAFSVNEQCIQYAECETFAAFIKAGKPVFNIEYPSSAPKVSESTRKKICSGKGDAAHTSGFSTVIKKMNLDGWVLYCTGNSYSTKIKTS
ncbi:Fc.00g100010.m01.CDS01 [Cosmosporella sp. VM-42]